MNVHLLSSTDKIALEKLRAQVVAARRWHHSQVQRLDAAWGDVQAQLAALPANRRAVHLEVVRRLIAKLIACVPASAFEAPADSVEVASLAPSASEAGDQLAT